MARARVIKGRRARKPAPDAGLAERERQQRKLDDALRDSFPASDPVSFLEPSADGETGPGATRRERRRSSG